MRREGKTITGRIDSDFGLSVFKTVLKIGKFYAYVIVIFAAAFICAGLGSFVDMLVQAIKIELPGSWPVRHWLWIGGAVFGAIGYPLGWIAVDGHKFRSFQNGLDREQDSNEPDSEQDYGMDENEIEVPSRVLPTAAMFGLLGAFMGLFLGGSLLLIWFSLSMSPWPPAGWLESVSAKSADLSSPHGSPDRESGFTTSYPVAIYCFLGPIALLGILGVFVGGVGSACGWIKDVKKKK